MFCQKCGNQIEDSAKFCEKCGEKTGNLGTTETVKIEDNTVVLNVKSQYKMLYYSLGFIFVTVLVLLIMIILGISLASSGDSVVAGVFFIIGIFTIIPIAVTWGITTLIRIAQFKKYTYDFYKTKIIYKDSFLNITEKEVKYKYIREVVYVQSFVQRWFNIGTITLYTNAESGFSNGIRILSVENVKSVYDEVKKVINV